MRQFIVFVSTKSMSIYLWHILILHYWNLFFPSANFVLTFLVVAGSAISLSRLKIFSA
jgi:peptidoglycan/LPS O-acetylase OafA/YrhL